MWQIWFLLRVYFYKDSIEFIYQIIYLLFIYLLRDNLFICYFCGKGCFQMKGKVVGKYEGGGGWNWQEMNGGGFW